MPDLKPDVSLLLNLYERCRANRCLPYPGGLLEQPEWILDMFDVIEEQKGLHRRVQQEHADLEATQARLRAEMGAKTRHG